MKFKVRLDKLVVDICFEMFTLHTTLVVTKNRKRLKERRNKLWLTLV